jgi:hypothetical protein
MFKVFQDWLHRYFSDEQAVVLAVLARVFRLSTPDRWVFAIVLSHVGEFAFLLLFNG